MNQLLQISDLSICFDQGPAAVESLSLAIREGETLALVGESGSGKSISALSILRLLDARHASYPSGQIRYRGEDLLAATERRMRQIRGREIGMIFQEPMTSLNPLHTVEKQIGETLELHKGMRGPQARQRCLELLNLVGIQNPESKLCAYPHQLSGGQKQRVMIAMALANEPDLLIADEPTTALDVTVQKQVLELLRDLQKKLGMAILLITHDLTIVRRYADRWRLWSAENSWKKLIPTPFRQPTACLHPKAAGCRTSGSAPAPWKTPRAVAGRREPGRALPDPQKPSGQGKGILSRRTRCGFPARSGRNSWYCRGKRQRQNHHRPCLAEAYRKHWKYPPCRRRTGISQPEGIPALAAACPDRLPGPVR